MKLSIIKTQIKATCNMLDEFSILKRVHNIDSGYDTAELTKLRSTLKKTIEALRAQMRSHPDYEFKFELSGTEEIQ